MANTYLETAFNVPVTPEEAALLEECFATAAEISAGFASIPQEELEAAKTCYASRSGLFRATFPPRADEDDPFATFLGLWSDPDFPCFDADLTVTAEPGGKGQVAYIHGHEVDVSALASLIQKVCKSALPFGFEWALVTDQDRPGGFGGGYFVVTETEILGGSTHWLMHETLQTLRAGA
ncbi:hypothetical protein [Edaphosphingomonas haloaromaticamans]|uniref:Uncharacterized protein n=1 Tax=Edaphosphingomonas haloaromaticamans TaxID=653954 RepID=A0A1S1HH84_9SPHN|nr:hypothetical protein [Sphingomonas haloaromaticamans]OHT21604.1 hypothetical protein BHE75_03615 [Sphingomonas haloaromaticamans]